MYYVYGTVLSPGRRGLDDIPWRLALAMYYVYGTVLSRRYCLKNVCMYIRMSAVQLASDFLSVQDQALVHPVSTQAWYLKPIYKELFLEMT